MKKINPQLFVLNSTPEMSTRVICVSRSKSPSFSSEFGFFGRSAGEDKTLAEVHIKFFRRPHELQSKRHHWKNYNCVGFVANLPNRPTDGATVSVRKRVTFRPLVSTKNYRFH
jgi:hypothetical protein